MKRRMNHALLAALSAALLLGAAGCTAAPGGPEPSDNSADLTGTAFSSADGSESRESNASVEATDEDGSTEPATEPEPEYTLKLTDVYRPNGITFSLFEAVSGDQVFRAPRIVGLKDETVESRINVALFQRVRDEVEAFQALYPEGLKELTVTPVLYASFSNVISVKTTLVIGEALGSGGEKDRPLAAEFYDSYELLTGRALSFRDLFKEDVTVGDLFGDLPDALDRAVLKDRKTLEVLKDHRLSEFADLMAEADRVRELMETGETLSFRFDEKEAALIFETGALLYEMPVVYGEHLSETLVYEKYLAEESIYEAEAEETYPVLFKRFPCRYSYFEDSDRVFADAVLYAPETGDVLPFVSEDAVRRIKERISEVKSASGNFIVYNAEYTLYEMKNGYAAGKPAPYYVSCREYVRTAETEEDFRVLRDGFVRNLQERPEAEAVLKKTLFLDGDPKTEGRFVTWYYDEAGQFIEESVLESAPAPGH